MTRKTDLSSSWRNRPVRFPELHRLDEVFDKIVDNKPGRPPPLIFMRPDYTNPKRQVAVQIEPFCIVSGQGNHRTLWVHPRPEVAAFLEHEWIGDSPGSWNVTIRSDGSALVTAQYERIIGSHWIALIDAASIPGVTVRPQRELCRTHGVACPDGELHNTRK